jgi:hypothetical protein
MNEVYSARLNLEGTSLCHMIPLPPNLKMDIADGWSSHFPKGG